MLSKVNHSAARYTLVLVAAATAAASASVGALADSINISSAAGIHWEFQPEGGTFAPILVPNGGWRTQGYTCDAGTYRTTLSIPQSAAARTVRIIFAAVNFGVDIYAGLDAQHEAHVASHVDGWVPVTADVTRVARPGLPLHLRVEVRGRRKFMVHGKYTVPEGATWDPYLEDGILRGVTLEILNKVRIEDAFVRSTVGPDILRTAVTVVNDTDHLVVADLQAALGSSNRKRYTYPRVATMRLSLPPHVRSVVNRTVKWAAGPLSYWWPNVPYSSGYRAQLHNLRLTLLQHGRTVSRYTQQFGFRQFAVKANFYTLNGVHCNLRGDNQQEADFGTDAYGIRPGFGPPSKTCGGWPEAVDNLLRLNFNVMRIHQIPATPYMLQVCDELGLMLVEESPLRGSEGGEDFKAGRTNMLNMDRQLVLRDRNHPSTVIWSAANEWAEPVPEAAAIIREVDDSRPIIADGTGDFDPHIINMEHYVTGGGPPITGGAPRADRPYGETEAVWPNDNTRQGFAWMATGVRIRRLLGDCDLRNYVLNNAWSNYVPGEGPENEIIEKRVKNMGGNMNILPALADPWSDHNIELTQQCYNPVAACDIEFDRVNAISNAQGAWPTVWPRIAAGTKVTRRIAVFNDEFADEHVTLYWGVQLDGTPSTDFVHGELDLTIPLGEHVERDITFSAPSKATVITLSLATLKNGVARFFQYGIIFNIVKPGAALIPDGNYMIVNVNSGLPMGVTTNNPDLTNPVMQVPRDRILPLWEIKNVGPNEVTIKVQRGRFELTVGRISTNGRTHPELENGTGTHTGIWKLAEAGLEAYTVTSVADGRVLDVYAQATAAPAELVLWQPNGGRNQQWRFLPVYSILIEDYIGKPDKPKRRH